MFSLHAPDPRARPIPMPIPWSLQMTSVPARAAVLAASLLTAFALCAGSVRAEGPAPAIAVELNKLETAGADCRATMVVSNGRPEALDSLKLDLVFFDAEGIVAKRLVTELGPLSRSKTVVKTFPVAGLACGSLSRVLINEAVACTGPSGPVADCVDALAPSSRAAAAFVK